MSTASAAAAAPQPIRAPLWRRLFGFNLLTGIIGAIIGYLVGYWIGGLVHAPSLDYFSAEAGQNDISVLLGYLFGVFGFLIGLGFGNYPSNGCWATRRRWPSTSPRARASAATSACAPITRWWRSSTWWGSGCSSSSAASTPC